MPVLLQSPGLIIAITLITAKAITAPVIAPPITSVRKCLRNLIRDRPTNAINPAPIKNEGIVVNVAPMHTANAAARALCTLGKLAASNHENQLLPAGLSVASGRGFL